MPAIRRAFTTLLSRLRRIAAGFVQLVLRNQISDLNKQTQRLGSASVESLTYLGGELHALNERMARIESELAALREALKHQSASHSS